MKRTIIYITVLVLSFISIFISYGLVLKGGSDPKVDPGEPIPSTTPVPEVHQCSQKCGVCGKCLDLICEEDACKDKCGGHIENSYKFEAEDPHVYVKGGFPISKGDITFIGNFLASAEASIKYSLTAAEATTASMIISIGKRPSGGIYTQNVLVMINGEVLSSQALVPNDEEDSWENFTEINLGCISLKQGTNVIDIIPISPDVSFAYNFDYMRLKTDVAVTWGPHLCTSECPVCGKCMDYTCQEDDCKDKCGDDLPDNILEAEDPLVERKNGTIATVNGVTHVGDFLYDKGASVKFNVEVSEDSIASLVLSVGKRQAIAEYTKNVKVVINGERYNSIATAPVISPGENDWIVFERFSLGCISLKKGLNTIELTPISENAAYAYNLDYINLKTTATVTLRPHQCTTPCVICGKCTDWLCEEAACQDKCTCDGTMYTFRAAHDYTEVSGTNKNVAGDFVEPRDTGRASFTMKIYSEVSTSVYINAYVSTHGVANVAFSSAYALSINGTAVTSTLIMPADGKGSWENYVFVRIGQYDFEEGINTITITFISKNMEELERFRAIMIQSEHLLQWYQDSPEHECESECPICGGCRDVYCQGNNCQEKCGHGKTPYTFTVDKTYVEKKNTSVAISNGTPYLGGFEDRLGASAKFKLYSDNAGTASLVVSICKRVKSAVYTDYVIIYINGVRYQSTTMTLTVKSDTWYDFAEINLGCVELVKGLNTIEFIANGSGDYCYNFAYIKLYADGVVSGYHECTKSCPTCGKCRDLLCTDGPCAEKCQCVESYYFVTYDGNAKVENGSVNVEEQQVGFGTGAKITFEINSDSNDNLVYLYMTLTAIGNGIVFDDNFILTVNGNQITSSEPMPAGGDWRTYRDMYVAKIELKEGLNTVVIQYKDARNVRSLTFVSEARLEWG